MKCNQWPFTYCKYSVRWGNDTVFQENIAQKTMVDVSLTMGSSYDIHNTALYHICRK